MDVKRFITLCPGLDYCMAVWYLVNCHVINKMASWLNVLAPKETILKCEWHFSSFFCTEVGVLFFPWTRWPEYWKKCPSFGKKVAQTVAEQKKCNNNYIEVQFENICNRPLLKH